VTNFSSGRLKLAWIVLKKFSDHAGIMRETDVALNSNETGKENLKISRP
jgi:hypothetical protein